MRPKHLGLIRAFDLLSSLSLGAVSALASSFLLPDAWWPPVAMIAGMGLGIVAALPVFGLLASLLGGFETVVMTMQVGMLAGMAGAMMRTSPSGLAALAGAGVGLAIHLLLRAYDRSLHGEVVGEGGSGVGSGSTG